jgi:hypothetical protein
VEVEAALELRDFLDVDPFADEPEAWEHDDAPVAGGAQPSR